MEQERQGNLVLALVLGVALACICALVSKATGIALFDEGAEAEISAKIAAERGRLPCDLTIAQFGPGERWFRHHHIYECARAARAVPNDVLSYPLAAQ